MELQCKLPSSWEINRNKSEPAFCWMLLLFLWVFKQLVEWWQPWFPETQQFLLESHRFSLPMLIISPVCAFKSLREKDKCQKTTICSEDSISMGYHLHLEECLKSKSASKLMRMESWMWQLLIKELQKMPRSLSPTTKADFPNRTSRDWSNRLRNSKTKTRRSERESKHATIWRDTAWMSSILSMTANWKESWLQERKNQLWTKSGTLKTGWTTLQTQKLRSMKPSRKKSKDSSIRLQPRCIKARQAQSQDAETQLKSNQVVLCQELTRSTDQWMITHFYTSTSLLTNYNIIVYFKWSNIKMYESVEGSLDDSPQTQLVFLF